MRFPGASVNAHKRARVIVVASVNMEVQIPIRVTLCRTKCAESRNVRDIAGIRGKYFYRRFRLLMRSLT